VYSIVIYLITGSLLVISLIGSRKKTLMALKKAWRSFEGILPELIAILLFIGLLIALLNPDTISQLLGESSGVWGLLIASVVGSITLIPGFVAFPTAAMLLDNGCRDTSDSSFHLHSDDGRSCHFSGREEIFRKWADDYEKCDGIRILVYCGWSYGNDSGMKAKRYIFPLAMAAVVSAVFAVDNQVGRNALSITGSSFLEMLSVIPPIFILLGLLDVWIPREKIIRHLGEESGIKGIVLSFLLGAAAAGPLYGAFPIAAVFMKKGVKFSNVLIFIGAWSTTKIPMFMFEMGSLGAGFALLRLAINIPGTLLMAMILEKITGKESIEAIYAQASSMSE